MSVVWLIKLIHCSLLVTLVSFHPYIHCPMLHRGPPTIGGRVTYLGARPGSLWSHWMVKVWMLSSVAQAGNRFSFCSLVFFFFFLATVLVQWSRSGVELHSFGKYTGPCSTIFAR